MIDFSRRHFIFGVTAALILPPKRTFHILDGRHTIIRPEGLILPRGKLFDLPDWHSMEIGRKLNEGIYKMSDVPRWVVLDQRWYDAMVKQENMTS